jgi:hypothetical protein
MISFNKIGSYGHLGNQMFQYAGLRGISHNRNFEWCLPPKELFGVGYSTRSSIYECFDLSSVKEQNINSLEQPNVEESGYGFDENIFYNCPDNVNINGFFQSYKYFINIKNEIKKDFSFKKEIVDSIPEIGEYACLHLRRTDYVSNNSYKELNWDYYSNALSGVPEQIPVIIISDDPDWCMQQEVFKNSRYVFSEKYSISRSLCNVQV